VTYSAADDADDAALSEVVSSDDDDDDDGLKSVPDLSVATPSRNNRASDDGDGGSSDA